MKLSRQLAKGRPYTDHPSAMINARSRSTLDLLLGALFDSLYFFPYLRSQ